MAEENTEKSAENSVSRTIQMRNKFRGDLHTGDLLKSPGKTITETHLVDWAGLTGDIVSFHVDAVEAANTPFGHRLAHGPLIVSVSLGLITLTGYFTNVIAWLGLDKVRSLSPVLIGDTIRVEASVTQSRQSSKPERGIWTLDYKVINQKDEVVMTFESSFMVKEHDD